jgi:hypothetical protein
VNRAAEQADEPDAQQASSLSSVLKARRLSAALDVDRYPPMRVADALPILSDERPRTESHLRK